MRPAKKIQVFALEVDLCAAFIAAIGDGWISYGETAGWDILLVRKKDGFQIGVQAKLKLGVDVINQAIEEGWSYVTSSPGPDCRAVLVPPNCAGAFDRICDYVGITIIRMRDMRNMNPRYNPAFHPGLPNDRENFYDRHWHEMCPTKRCELPEYVPDVRAGASAPLQLTQWKIKAIKLAVLIEERGHVTRHDFSHLSLDHRRWIAQGWLKVVDGRLVPDAPPKFKKQHPVVYKQIKADMPKWAPKERQLELPPPPKLL